MNKINYSKDYKWNQWLAGLIDGDGCFETSNKSSIAQFSLTMHSSDERCLYRVKQKIGGSVKPVSGARAMRLRLSSKPHIKSLVERINPFVLNSIRRSQLNIVCEKLGIEPQNTDAFSWESSYGSGLFDSDGSVVLSVKKHEAGLNLGGLEGKVERLKNARSIQLSIKVTQKLEENVAFMSTPFPQVQKGTALSQKSEVDNKFGYIYLDKAQNSYYSWCISCRSDILRFCHYNKQNPSRSVKMHRLLLIPRFYELWSKKPYNSEPNSLLKKQWFEFAEKWFKYSC